MKKLLPFLFLSFIAQSSFAQNYFLTTSKDGVEEVYIMSVTSNRSSHSLVVVDRIKPAEGKLQDFRHSVAATTKKDNLDKLGYYKRKIQFSCADKKYRIMECTWYELSGKEIDKTELDEEKVAWSRIVPGTVIDAEFQKVCKK